MHNLNSRISVVGIDSSGKSLTTTMAVQRLSETYDTTPIRIVDSTGVRQYLGGELSHARYEHLERLKAPAESGKVSTVVRTGLFTACRRALESSSIRTPGLTIGVRDPYRVDPAVMLPEFLPATRNFDAKRRLAICHKLALAAHPLEVIRLDVDPQFAYSLADARGALDAHETLEGLERAADDLVDVTDTYAAIYSVKTSAIEGLQHDTIDRLAELIEPHITTPSS